ncbi:MULTISPECIES: hypothetical protein [Paenibacillus]|uniref:hypothetical protein n=1 Tax=Paenibacillus TaxID=44249 RepID=UPI0022B8DAA9|nr:hypothetical protein [Paenibacillus caseinilyticus]MCZ8518385.1 hypothetical protein [Paenibacillus caseinilyticus]
MKKLALILSAVFMLQFSILSSAFALGLNDPVYYSKNALSIGGTLEAGQSLKSNNGTFSLVMQRDGNLVLYKNGGTPIWSVKTDKLMFPANTLKVGPQIVVSYTSSFYNSLSWFSDNYKWSIASGRYPEGTEYYGQVMIVQDDGNVVLYNTKGTTDQSVWYPVWASDTAGR